jgi:hypothetical protein
MRLMVYAWLGLVLVAGCAESGNLYSSPTVMRCDRNGDQEQRAACTP